MSLILKIMSGEDLADDDSRKGFVLKTGVIDVEFGRDPQDVPFAAVLFQGSPERETFYLANNGNVYVMNERGMTIAAHCPVPIHGEDEEDRLEAQSEFHADLKAAFNHAGIGKIGCSREDMECIGEYMIGAGWRPQG